MKKPSIFVAILNYGQPQLTIDCLHTAVPEARRIGNCVLGVCENGSNDNSAEIISEAIKYEGWDDVVELKVVTPNLGFTGGNNAIIKPKMASDNPPDYVLLLNNDTLVYEGAFEQLASFMEQHSNVGITGSRLENPNGTAQCSAFRFTGVFSEIECGVSFGPVSRLLNRWKVAPDPPKRASETDWVSGASLMIRQSVIEEVGVLDSNYYTYFDDIDYCWNARLAGWSVWYVPTSRVIHIGGVTTGIDCKDGRLKRRPDYWFEARRRYYTKNYGTLRSCAVDLAYLMALMLGHFIAWLRGKPRELPERFLLDVWRHSTWMKGGQPPIVVNPALNQKISSRK